MNMLLQYLYSFHILYIHAMRFNFVQHKFEDHRNISQRCKNFM